eukprot:47479-Eustigmatos_ZCMA.PRE.1
MRMLRRSHEATSSSTYEHALGPTGSAPCFSMTCKQVVLPRRTPRQAVGHTGGETVGRREALARHAPERYVR